MDFVLSGANRVVLVCKFVYHWCMMPCKSVYFSCFLSLGALTIWGPDYVCIVKFNLCIVGFASSMFYSPDSVYLKFVFCVHARVCSVLFCTCRRYNKLRTRS